MPRNLLSSKLQTFTSNKSSATLTGQKEQAQLNQLTPQLILIQFVLFNFFSLIILPDSTASHFPTDLQPQLLLFMLYLTALFHPQEVIQREVWSQ